MARIRSIKPEFWTDSKTGTLSEFSKCLFLGLLSQADDFGVVEWRPIEWRAKIFPYHSDTTTGTVQAALVDELLPAALLQIFYRQDEDGLTKQYAFIRNFGKHQVINKPSLPLLFGWKKNDTPRSYANRNGDDFDEIGVASDGITPTPPEGSRSTTVVLPSGEERKGEERNSSETNVSGAEAPASNVHPIDAKTALFREGLTVLSEITGRNVGSLRSEVGRWCKLTGDDYATVLASIRRARDQGVIGPIAWIEASLKPKDPDAAIYRGVL